MSDVQAVPFQDERPVYGKNFGRGWIGFNHDTGWMSQGIAYFTRPSRQSDIIVTHAFIVRDEHTSIEAAYGKGVVTSNLDEMYFDEPERAVVFRKPRGLTEELADRIVGSAEGQLGADFDHYVLANHVAQDNFVGWLLNWALMGQPKDYVDRMIASDQRWICSQLAAYALQQQPEYAESEVLSRNSLGALDPQTLFESEELFEPLADSGGAAPASAETSGETETSDE